MKEKTMIITCKNCYQDFITAESKRKRGRLCSDCKKKRNLQSRRLNYKKNKVNEFYKGL